ncbi:type II toxin-antitoxin system HicA family toxin [Arthrobacter sp. PAMC 25486]|uniref:type II toxin-antitoxin system HicA family toxin n=1 Tax=Arthrobacter sp. PAMC 25486 TaxID=1494608 RepID=UPI003463EA13
MISGMTKSMTYRELVKLLVAAGFTVSEGKGEHEKRTHPAPSRPVVITQSREVSPGVTRNALQAIAEVEGQGS